MQQSIKILIAYKRNTKQLRSGVFVPIQTGAAIGAERFEGMLHDDEGENISEKNESFCELTAIYWAWKNYEQVGNPDYIGFMHHRRHFIFNDREYQKDKWGLVEFADLDEEYMAACSLHDEAVQAAVEGYDALLPEKCNVGLTVREQYEHYHRVEDFDLAMQILKQMQPEYAPLAAAYSKSKEAYYLLMGIYKREIFFRYCEWLFGLLSEIGERIDVSDYTAYQKRAYGFLAERLTGIFFLKLAEEGKKLRHMRVAFLANEDSLTPPQYVQTHRVRYYVRYLYSCVKYALFRREKYREKKRRLRQQLREARQWAKQLNKS